METTTLELECGKTAIKKDNKDADVKDRGFCVYKPFNVSVELDLESYSAMRYHGQ